MSFSYSVVQPVLKSVMLKLVNCSVPAFITLMGTLFLDTLNLARLETSGEQGQSLIHHCIPSSLRHIRHTINAF